MSDNPARDGMQAARDEEAMRRYEAENPYAVAMLCSVSAMIDRLVEVEQSLMDRQFLGAAGGYMGIDKMAADAAVISTLMARHVDQSAVERARTREVFNAAGRRVRCTVPE